MDYTGEHPDFCSGNTDFAMSKYLLLHNQHEELRQQLYELCPSYSNTSSSTAVTSPSVSPTRSFSSTSSSSSPKLCLSPTRNHRRSSHSSALSSGFRHSSQSQLPPVLDECLVAEMAAGEQKLSDVNEGIKRALTELLNCEAVRRDRATRTWVQTRLMDTEKELRRGRRRRSNGSDA